MTGKDRQAFYEGIARSAIRYPPTSGRRDSQTDPGVSVIVRTVDRPPLLREALASLANQTFRDFEVIVVRDGGTGTIDDVARDFFPYLELRVIQLEPQGRVTALNEGLKAARGDWICYLDDDDIVYPNHLQRL